MDVAVTFDAEGLNGGDYAAEIVVANNDPFNSEVTVPVDLHVTGAPDIDVSETLIDYGEVFIGAEIPHMLTVTNAGTDVLAVSDISSSHPDYTVDIPSFTLAPGTSRDVAVTFAPTSVGMIAATMTITTNDPDEPTLDIELRGEGLEPPVISVTPDALTDSLFTGQSSAHTLNIANTGGSNLEFDINTKAIDMVGASAVVKTSISVPRSTGDFPRGTYPPSYGPAPKDGQPAGSAPSNAAAPAAMGGSAFATETSNYQTTRFNLNVPEILNFVGPALEFIWAGDFGSRDNSFAYAIDGLNRFVRIDTLDGSQTVLGTVTPYGSEGWTGMALDPTDGRMYATSTNIGSSSLYEIDLDASTATRIGSIGLPGIISLAVDTDGNMFAHDIVTDELISIDKTTGVGTPIGSLGFDANYGQGMAFDPVTEQLYLAAFNNYTFTAELRIADRTTGATALIGALGATTPGGIIQLGWLGIPGLGGVPWLTLDPKSGIVPPGASMNIDVSIDAAGLFGGDYLADIVVANNDPLNPEVTVPAFLHVTGAPDIDVSETAIDYGPVFIGAAIPHVLTVTNAGTDALTVSGISSNNPDYTVDITDFTLAPLESQNVIVTFAPTTAAPLTGTLTITANDPDEPVVLVELLGEGIEPPVISVTPHSLSDSLFTGETSTQTLTIGNTGGSDLDFELSVEDVGGAMNAVDVIADVSL
ncbi:MAG: choice-of-anchor D domain-containing protein, partial [bacterium]